MRSDNLDITITAKTNGRFCGRDCPVAYDDYCGMWNVEREYEWEDDRTDGDYVRIDKCLEAENG